jgi:hypothetical protein
MVDLRFTVSGTWQQILVPVIEPRRKLGFDGSSTHCFNGTGKRMVTHAQSIDP